MLKNVISSAQNTVEIAALIEARQLSITTGGWMPGGFRRRSWREGGRNEVALSQTDADRLGLHALAQGSYSKADRANLVKADLILLFDCMEGVLLARTGGRQRRISDWRRKRGRPLEKSYLSSSEIPRIIERCHELHPEVLNVVCLQEHAENSELGALASFFFGELFAAMRRENLVQQGAGAVWRKRRVDATSEPGIRSIEAARQKAKKEVFGFLDAIPLDATAKAAIFEEAFRRVDAELAPYEPQDLVPYEPQSFEDLQTVCLRTTLKAVYESRPEALPPRIRRFLKNKPNVRPDVWQKKCAAVLTRSRDRSEDQGVAHAIRAACQKMANTRVRADRALRTYLLLELGGCAVASPGARTILRKLTRKAAKIHPGFQLEQFNERFRDIQVPGQRAGWASALRLGKYLGDRWQQLRGKSPFKRVLESRDTDKIETELFFFADEFTRDDSLWTQEHLAGFAHALCWLCEDREDHWRQWLDIFSSAASAFT